MASGRVLYFLILPLHNHMGSLGFEIEEYFIAEIISGWIGEQNRFIFCLISFFLIEIDKIPRTTTLTTNMYTMATETTPCLRLLIPKDLPQSIKVTQLTVGLPERSFY